jgi:hypothetical protein
MASFLPKDVEFDANGLPDRAWLDSIAAAEVDHQHAAYWMVYTMPELIEKIGHGSVEVEMRRYVHYIGISHAFWPGMIAFMDAVLANPRLARHRCDPFLGWTYAFSVVDGWVHPWE